MLTQAFFLFQATNRIYMTTNPDWAPSLKLGPQKEESQSATLSSKKRYERTRTRDEQKTKFRTAQALLDLQSSQMKCLMRKQLKLVQHHTVK